MLVTSNLSITSSRLLGFLGLDDRLFPSFPASRSRCRRSRSRRLLSSSGSSGFRSAMDDSELRLGRLFSRCRTVSAGSAKISSSRGAPRGRPPLRTLSSSSCDRLGRCAGPRGLPFIPCEALSGRIDRAAALLYGGGGASGCCCCLSLRRGLLSFRVRLSYIRKHERRGLPRVLLLERSSLQR